MTVHDALGGYLEHAHRHYRPRSLVWAAQVLWSFMGQFGDVPVGEVGILHLTEFIGQPKEHEAGIFYWSRPTRRRAARVVIRALAWAAAPTGT